MSDQKVDKIEKTIDRATANALAVNRAGGGTFSVAPQNMGELLEFAKLMSVSSFCVRPKFRGNPGACLGVALQAFRCGGDPFAWANKAYITTDKAGEEQIGYEAQLVHAVVNSSAVLERRLRPTYEGEGTARRCRIVGFVKGEPEALEYLSPPISQIGVKNSPLWVSDPDQQLFYYSTRAWARRHVPEILLGIYVPEEIDTIDITPEAEPQREVTRREPEQVVDERPEFIVVDSEGQEFVFREPVKASSALMALLEDAGRLNRLDLLDGVWESNQAAVEQIGASEMQADVAVLAGAYADFREKLTARPGVAVPDAGRPDAGAAAETVDRSRGADAPVSGQAQGSPQTSEAADANGTQKPVEAPSAAAAPAPAIKEPQPFPGDLPTGQRADAPTPTSESKLGLGVLDAGRLDRTIAMTIRNGRPDFRTWVVGLFQPKLRQMKTSNDLADLLGHNAENLEKARQPGALDPDVLRELESRITAQWEVAKPDA